jgi:hypothetical protein
MSRATVKHFHPLLLEMTNRIAQQRSDAVA